MDKKEAKTEFSVEPNIYVLEKLKALSNYKKASNVFKDGEDHEREARVRKVITDLEDRRSMSGSSKKEALILTIYLIVISAAEIIVAYNNVELGLILEIVILFALLINLSTSESSNFSNLLRAMMVLPMIRIIGLTIPIMQIEHLYWFPIVAIPLFAASYTLIRTQRLNRKKIGLILGNVPVQLIIALSGVILGFTEYLILRPQPLISSFTLETVLIASVILVISTGFAEELLFRGILQRNAENVVGNLFGLLYASLLFTALHVGWHSSLDLLFVFGVAMFYGYAFQKTRSLLGVTLSHGVSNTFLFLIMPFIFPLVLPYMDTIISWIIHYI